MIEVKSVIVTVRCPAGQTDLDLEMPAFVPVSRLRAMLLETMRALRPQQWLAVSSLALSDGESALPDGESLASLGLWDGSILTVRPEEEGSR